MAVLFTIYTTMVGMNTTYTPPSYVTMLRGAFLDHHDAEHHFVCQSTLAIDGTQACSKELKTAVSMFFTMLGHELVSLQFVCDRSCEVDTRTAPAEPGQVVRLFG